MRRLVTLTAIVAFVAAFGMTLSASPALAGHCDATVTAPSSIQDAVDAADFGDVVCLDDSGGSFFQTVVFGSEDSGITLTAEDGDAPTMDGTATGFAEAIRLLDGVTDVTIEGLEIRDYFGASCCGVGNAIQAWAVNTSNITVEGNYMHDNNYSAILVGSEGTQTHTGWAVHNNTVTDNATEFFSPQIELTNCNGCSIHRNTVSGGAIGILVQARNTVPDSGLVELHGVSVKNNTVSSTTPLDGSPTVGVYVLSLASGPVDPFPPIVGAQANLQSVSLARNSVSGERAVQVLGFLGGQVINPTVVRNELSCTGGLDIGIRLLGQVTNVKIIKNDVDSCTTPLFEDASVEDTKLPAGLDFP